MNIYNYFRIGEVDEYDIPVRKTKKEYPYGYDGFVVHRVGNNSEANETVYSDRLWQWDHSKYNKSVEKVFGDHRQMFYQATSDELERMLREYFDNPKLKLILVMEYCNVSNGYPVWRFDYNNNK